MKTIAEINEKIKKGGVVVVRADEMAGIVEEKGLKKAAQEVDVVTTGTFGPMCSSGVFLNFGHADPPIKMQKVWLNEVEAYTGIAAVDAYIGATELSLDRGMEYGGGHVIEDLIKGGTVKLKATAYSTDCYPRRYVETEITLNDINQAIMYNPRNSYQKYNAATNSQDRTMFTYMGTLLPHYRNINYAGTGELSPLNNDPSYRTIGLGTRIFLGGTKGYVTGPGTQHSPTTGYGTIAVQGNLKEMSTDYIRGATMVKYGTTLCVGIGIPIPVLDEEIAKTTSTTNKDIKTKILDYGIAQLNRPTIREVTYEELTSGTVELENKNVKTSPMSSFRITHKIIETLGKWIEDKEFYLTEPIETLPRDTIFKPMKIQRKPLQTSEVMTKPVITAQPKESVRQVSNLMVEKGIDQIPIVDKENRLVGIVTSWDITKATAENKRKLEDFMTKNVISSKTNELLDVVSRRLEKYGINSTPVVDEENKVVGIITLSDINRVYSRRTQK